MNRMAIDILISDHWVPVLMDWPDIGYPQKYSTGYQTANKAGHRIPCLRYPVGRI